MSNNEELKPNPQNSATGQGPDAKARNLADKFQLRILDNCNSEKDDFIAKYIQSIGDLADYNEPTESSDNNLEYRQIRSTKYGEMLYLNYEYRVCLVSNRKQLVDKPVRDFEIIHDWNKKGIYLEQTEEEAMTESLLNSGKKLKILPVNNNKASSKTGKVRALSVFKSEDKVAAFAKDHHVCSCIYTQSESNTANKQILRNWDTMSFRSGENLQEIQFDASDAKAIKADDSGDWFCFGHEKLVCWDNGVINFFNMYNYRAYSLSTGSKKITFVSLGLFPKIAVYFGETKEIYQVDVLTKQAVKFASLKDMENNKWKAMVYNYEDNSCVFYDRTSYLIVRQGTSKPGKATKVGEFVHFSQKTNLLYFIHHKDVYRMDIKTKKREVLTPNNNFFSFTISPDESRIYLGYWTEDSGKGKRYGIQIIDLGTLKTVCKIPLKIKPFNIRVNYDNSKLFYSIIEELEISNITLLLSLNCFDQEIVGRFDSFIVGLSRDCKSVFTVNGKHELFHFSLGGNLKGSKKNIPISTKSRILHFGNKILTEVFQDGILCLCLFDESFNLLVNVSDRINQAITKQASEVKNFKKMRLVSQSSGLGTFNQSNLQLDDENHDTRNLVCIHVNKDSSEFIFLRIGTGDIIRTDGDFENVMQTKTKNSGIVHGCYLQDLESIITLDNSGNVNIHDLASGDQLNAKYLMCDVLNFCLDVVHNQLFCFMINGKIHILSLQNFKVAGKINFLDKYLSLSDFGLTTMSLSPDANYLYMAYNSILTKIKVEETLNFPEQKALNSLFNSSGKMQTDEQFESRLNQWLTTFKTSSFLNKYFNPFFIAACNGITKGITPFVQKKQLKYPFLNTSQVSPIVLCCFTNNLFLLDEICNYLRQSPELYLTNEEISFLLRIDRESVTKLLIELFKPIPRNYYIMLSRGFADSPSKSATRDLPFYSRALFASFLDPQLQNYISKTETYQLLLKISELQKQSTAANILANKSEAPKKLKKGPDIEINSDNQVIFFELKAKYDFSTGSKSSLNFLRFYSKCADKEFILSNWRYVIKIKWQSLRYFYWMQAFLYISQVILFTANYFYDTFLGLYLVNLILLICFLIYELFSIWFYPRYYFNQADNILDLVSIISAIVLLTINFRLEKDAIDWTAYDVFFCLVILFLYIRSILYLKAIQPFRHLITMLFAIAFNIIDIIVFFAIIVIAFGFLLSVSNMENMQIGSGIYNGLLALFGGLDNIENASFIDVVLKIVIGVFVSLIMANFIIGRISNQYGDMENYQIAVSYSEMARILFEWEVWYFKLAKMFGRKKKNGSSQATSNNSKYYFFLANFDGESGLEEEKLTNEIMSEQMLDFKKVLYEGLEEIQAQNDHIIHELTNVYSKSEDIHNAVNDASVKTAPRKSIAINSRK
jgi:hypothetical protein